MLVSKDKKQTLYEDGISPAPAKQESGSGNNSTVAPHETQYGYQGDLILPTAPDYAAPELPTLPEYNDVTGFKAPDAVKLPEYSAPADFSAPADMAIPDYVTPGAFSAPTIDRSGSDRWQAQLDALYSEITGRAPFEFDLNGEALYQQYRDAALRDGALAMCDTAAQGAALSGGYGSSYSQSAAQQSYNAQLERLNDRIPDIYEAALDRYDREGNRLKDLYSLAADSYSRAYNAENDDYNRAYTAESDRYAREKAAADDAYNRQYNAEADRYAREYQTEADRYAREKAAADDAYNRQYNAEADRYAREYQTEADRYAREKAAADDAYDRQYNAEADRYAREYQTEADRYAREKAAADDAYDRQYDQAIDNYNMQRQSAADAYDAALDRYDREYKAVSDEYDRQLDLTALYNDYLAARNENSASGSSDTGGSEAEDGTDIDGMSDTEIYEIVNTMLSRGSNAQQTAAQIERDPRLETRAQKSAALEILDYVTKNAALK